MQTFKQVPINTCKEKRLNLNFIRICIFYIFSLNLTNMFLLFFDKNYYMPDDCFCMKLRVAWMFFSFILLIIYICALYIDQCGLVTDHRCL